MLNSDDLDHTAAIDEIRQEWPEVGIITLSDSVIPGADLTLSLNATLDELQTAVNQVIKQVQDRLPETLPNLAYDDLYERVQRMDSLMQMAFSFSKEEKRNILSHLRDVARSAVDADDVAVLLTDTKFQVLNDTLNLGTPGNYLEVCRSYFESLMPDQRREYLGTEVMLRERLPNMLNSVMRVRESEAANAWSYMRLPLMVNEQLAGCVSLFSNTPGRFDGAHLQLGRLFVVQVATAVRNLRLYFQLQRAEQRQQAVREVAQVIAENHTLDAVLAHIVAEAVRLARGRHGAVLLTQPDGNLLVSAIYGPTQHTVGARCPRDAGQAGHILKTKQPHIVYDYPDWDQAIDSMRARFPPNAALLGVPLIYRDDVCGVLQVVRSNSIPGSVQADLDVLMMLAPQAATAIVKAQLHETARQERQQLEAVLNHTAAIVIVLDHAGRVTLTNHEADRLLERANLPLDVLKETPLTEIMMERLPEQAATLNDVGPMIELNLGDLGEYLVRIAPIKGENDLVEHYVCVGQDISQLRQLNRMKSDLIHILSHDLRNPLSLARGSVDMLDDPLASPGEYEQLKGMIVSSLERMEQLIKDVMDMEMAESIGLQTATPFNLPTLVQNVIKRHQDKAERGQIALQYHENPSVPQSIKGHAILVGQAIENLVSNAIKYTPQGGQVDITLYTEDEYAVVEIKDNGIGIPAESLPHIFDQFYRVQDKRARHVEGTGLGLSLVQAIAQGHGGHVAVDSTLNVGSTFRLCLPLKEPLSATDSSQQVKQIDLSGLLH
jgi:signal transduction histidine kinase